MDLSLIIPVFNEEESLPKLHDWLHRVLNESKLTAEIIFIDDGSSDRSWPIIREFCDQHVHVKGIRLQGNQGKSFALQAGFDQVKGDVVITLDADMQDSPDEIPELYRLIKEEAYDLVSGWKKKRYDPLEKRLPSRFFNGVTRMVSGIKLHDFNCGLKAYRREVVKSITLYGEMHRYIPLLAKWNGFGRIGEKVVEHRAREYGKTKFGFERYLTGFLDLLSVVFVTRFKKRPMHFFGGLGSISIFIGLSITTFVIGDKVYRIAQHLPVRDVVDQPLFFLALVALIVGVQLFLAGFLAELILRMAPGKKEQVAEKLN